VADSVAESKHNLGRIPNLDVIAGLLTGGRKTRIRSYGPVCSLLIAQVRPADRQTAVPGEGGDWTPGMVGEVTQREGGALPAHGRGARRAS